MGAMEKSGNELNEKGHFTGIGRSFIHTARIKHIFNQQNKRWELPPPCNAVALGVYEGSKNCDHKEHSQKPDSFKDIKEHLWGKGQQWSLWPSQWWEAHHAICIGSVNKYFTLKSYKDFSDFIDRVYRVTKWCIHQSNNMIALPCKNVYKSIRKYKNKDVSNSVRKLNLPCHKWDHDGTGGYNDEVTREMCAHIWDPLANHKTNNKKQICKLSDEVVVKQLNSLSEYFICQLRKRGERCGGTKIACTKTAQSTRWWWLPFSMAMTPIARRRPAYSLADGPYTEDSQKSSEAFNSKYGQKASMKQQTGMEKSALKAHAKLNKEIDNLKDKSGDEKKKAIATMASARIKNLKEHNSDYTKALELLNARK